MLAYVQDSCSRFLTVPVLCCSLEYHSQMVSDAVKRVIKQGKVSICDTCHWPSALCCGHNCQETNMSDNTNSINTQRECLQWWQAEQHKTSTSDSDMERQQDLYTVLGSACPSKFRFCGSVTAVSPIQALTKLNKINQMIILSQHIRCNDGSSWPRRAFI